MRGRKPKPTAVKQLNGNPGKRALNKKEPDYPCLGSTPPDFLDEHGQKEWRRVFPMLSAIKVIKAPEAAFLRPCLSVARRKARWLPPRDIRP